MTEAEALKEATGAAFAFQPQPDKCRRFGLWKDDVKDNDLVRAIGSLKGAISSIPECSVKAIILRATDGSASFVNIDQKYIGLTWEEDISSLLQLRRIEAMIKTLQEQPETLQPSSEVAEKEEEITEQIKEKEEQPSIESLLDAEKQTVPPPQPKAEPELEPEPEPEPEPTPEPEPEPVPQPEPEPTPEPEPPQPELIYSEEVINAIAMVLKKYLEDFSDAILENELTDLGINPDKQSEFKGTKIKTLVDKLHNSTSLLIGPSSASDMKEEVLKAIVDFAREV
ncbi:MAG: hypothetical protein ACP5FK_02235 [bacterium]